MIPKFDPESLCYWGPVWLKNWSDSATQKVSVSFELEPALVHPFKHLPVGGKAKHGQRFYMLCWMVDDDETQVIKPRLRFGEMPRTQQAALRCKSPSFQQWAFKLEQAQDLVLPDNLVDAAKMVVYKVCEVTSLTQLDKKWDKMNEQYEREVGFIK